MFVNWPSEEQGHSNRSAAGMNQSASDISLIDGAVELFEHQWTEGEHSLIERLAGQQPVNIRDELLLELIRADIGRRYAIGQDVDLQNYLDRFPAIASTADAIATICFEDFRARRHRGRSLMAARWSRFPAVRSQSWFVELQTGSSQLEASAVFEPDEKSGNASQVATSSCSAPSTSLFDSEILGDFELVALLGQGAFSKVYLARQVPLGSRYVAVKVVDQPLREASHLARLQHTGIVPLYSCHRTRDKWILCFPYSGSATLADWLKGETTPGSRTGRSLVATIHNAQNRIREATFSEGSSTVPSKPDADPRTSLRAWHQAAVQPLNHLAAMSATRFSLWMAGRLASALAHAHQRGIVHGDLKPANILIRNDGEPALIDFNLSQITDAAPKSWRGGTLPYMAPEQLGAMISRTTGPAREQSDIFALGVILFELVEGHLPFDGPASTAETDVLLAVRNRSSLPEFRERQTCTEGLRSIIRKCLADDPTRRYSSAVTLLEDLDCEASNSPLKHAKESLIHSGLPKLKRRFPGMFSAGSITVVSLLLLAILLNALLGFQRRSQRLASLASLALFEQQSDLQFARFLQADSSSSHVNTTSEELFAMTRLVTDHLNEDVDLPVEDRTRTEERLLALAFIEAHKSLQTQNAADTGRESLRILLAILPPSAKSTQTGQVIQAIASGTPVTKQALLSGAQESAGVGVENGVRNADVASQSATLPRAASQLSAADQTLKALALLLQSEPRRSLELLESTEPPESLRLIHWMSQGRALLEIGEPRRAIAAFTMAMRDGSSSHVSLNRGLAYFRLGSLNEADSDFTACIQQSPEEASGYLNRYAVRIAMGRVQEAMRDLDRAIELQPESARLRLIRSREHRRAGRLKAAKDDFDLAMKSRPKTVEDWLSVALAKLPINAHESLKDLESAETLYGPDPSILQTMAHVLSEHLQRPEDAIQALDRVLKLEPSFQKALAGRAVLRARLGQVPQAIADVKRLESLDAPPTSESLYQMACSLALCSRTQPDLQLRSLTLLAQAVRQNYGGDLMAEDSDLDSIRSRPEFEIIQKNYDLISLGRKR
jgi:serine/threonine protein kinase/Flp pilus assembly protein TadD